MELSKYFSKDWYDQLKDYLNSDEFKDIGWKIAEERKKKKIYPEKGEDTFLKVFRVTPLEQVKVVIIGQDPYPQEKVFDGLAFSNRNSKIKPSPSLKNILDEVERDVYDNFDLSTHSNISLYKWAEQGVLLLNTAHTVVSGSPGSHLHYWRGFTNEVVNTINRKNNVVWLLWGSHAHKLESLITNSTHSVLKTTHPSPFSYDKSYKKDVPAFKNSGVFSKVNKYLTEVVKTEPIYW